MIDFSNVTSGGGGGDFDLIPAGTIARAILTIKRGGEVLKEYSQEPMFKSSERGTKWIECEFVIVGGPYNKRRFWQNIMLDGGRVDPETGICFTKKIGMETIKDIIDSAKGLSKSDISPEAMQTRNINGLEDMDGNGFKPAPWANKGDKTE